MLLLVRITLGYLLAGALVVTLFRDNPAVLLAELALRLPASFKLFLHMAWWVVPVVIAMFLFIPRKVLVKRLSRAAVAILACMAFFLTFTMLKTTMPFIVPFWADPLMAQVDRALHFGTDPWQIVHSLGAWINPDWAASIYFTYWGAPAMFLPVMLFLFDGDEARIRRFILLYAFAWLVLGNVLALTFLSAGPVYYDRLLGGDFYSGLDAALASSGISTGYMGSVHERLWSAYVSGAQEAGSGISAFPSVHLGMITVIALYLFERARWLAPVSIAIVLVYEFFSVYLGWHYAVDGYASIALVTGAWALLRRRSEARANAPLRAPAVAAE